jgi:hypothetical protein
MMTKAPNVRYWAGGLVLIAAAVLYLLTLDNGLRADELTGGDLITHQYAQVEARPSNAPGYPLYTMGGWLWFRLGRAGLGWALNPIQILSLYSTLWALASLFILYLILLKVSRGQWPLALLLTAFYATTYFFWYYSITTEQYTSAVCQTLLIIWLAFQWDESPRDSNLLWLVFISGTMLANMVTTLFILPPLLWFILFKDCSLQEGSAILILPQFARLNRVKQSFLYNYLKKPKLILQTVGVALLPLFSYVYVYIRGAQHPEWRGVGQWSSTWDWFVQFLTIQQGRDELEPGLTLQNFFTDEFPALMGQELTWLVFWGGLFGLVFLGRRRAIYLYSTLIVYFVFSWGYRFGNWFQVIVPAYPIFIIGFAAGMNKISSFIKNQETPISRFTFYVLPFTFHVLLIGLLLYRFTTSLPRANQRNLPADTGLDPAWAILVDNPVSPAVISGDFEERVALQYLKTVWGVAPLIYPTDAGDSNPPPGVEQDGIVSYISRRAVAMTPGIIQFGEVFPQAVGEQLIALWPTPRTKLPDRAVPLDIDYGDQLRLVGWEQLETDDLLPQDVAYRLQRANWKVALYWQTSETLAEDYTISVRPLVGGQLIIVDGEAMIQDHQPVWGIYPTSRWTPTEIVCDVYALSVPEEATPEAVQIIVYQATDTGFEDLAEATVRAKD